MHIHYCYNSPVISLLVGALYTLHNQSTTEYSAYNDIPKQNLCIFGKYKIIEVYRFSYNCIVTGTYLYDNQT